MHSVQSTQGAFWPPVPVPHVPPLLPPLPLPPPLPPLDVPGHGLERDVHEDGSGLPKSAHLFNAAWFGQFHAEPLIWQQNVEPPEPLLLLPPLPPPPLPPP